MPKKMPKPEAFGSIKGILDQGYADAMENLTEGMKKAAIQGLFSPTDPERNFGMYKRTVRMLLSQGDNFIVDFFNKVDPKTLADPKIAKDFATTVANKLGGFDQQKAMNYASGIIEGHHGVSVDSIFSAAKHLPMKDRLEFIRTLSNEYGVSGTVGGDMYPLSRFGHQGKGTGSVFPKASAHTSANPLEIANSKGFPVNTGTWSREFDFSDITNPRKLADAFMQQSGFPQMAMADQAFDSPEELGIRKELAERLGIRERDLYTKSKDFNPRGQAIQKKIKELGIDVQEMVHRHYGLPYTPRAPLVKDPNAPKRIPKPTVAPTFEEASQFAKGWFDEADFRPTQAPVARLMPPKAAANATPTIDPELVSQFSGQIGNRINRRLGKSPFDATLDTTSQKYLENIGKYQQFIDLDEASKAALGLYGENVKQYYADLNRQLRTGSSANLTPQQIAVNEFLQSNLSRTLDALPSEQRDLYRAIKDPVREGLTNLKVGDIYTDKGFGSFSADERAALRFIKKDAPSALITVQNAKGKNIGPVMEFDEAEFLQKPGSQYRLEAVDEIFSPKAGGNVPNYRFTQLPSKVARNPLMRGAKAISRAIPGPVDALIPGVVGGGLALAGGATLPQAAEAFGGGVAEGLSGDLEGAPEPTVTMVNVGGKMRPLNTGTNTLMDKPGYGLEQSNGQWREVQRGMGAASKQQSKVQADQLIPVPKPVMANTPTGVAQLKAMPKPKNIDLVNEAQYFIINPFQKAFKNVFGNREI